MTMTQQEATKQEEQHQRTLAVLKRMVAEKRAYEQQAVENYKNDPELQALIARLDQKNKERETPIA